MMLILALMVAAVSGYITNCGQCPSFCEAKKAQGVSWSRCFQLYCPSKCTWLSYTQGRWGNQYKNVAKFSVGRYVEEGFRGPIDNNQYGRPYRSVEGFRGPIDNNQYGRPYRSVEGFRGPIDNNQYGRPYRAVEGFRGPDDFSSSLHRSVEGSRVGGLATTVGHGSNLKPYQGTGGIDCGRCRSLCAQIGGNCLQVSCHHCSGRAEFESARWMDVGDDRKRRLEAAEAEA